MFKGSSKLGLWGVIATIVYFLAIAYLIFYTNYVKSESLTLNELGDFFAGVFGPPALIWVVISFYLQSEELKNSVSALRLQAEELAKSVEQQIVMAGLTRESITHEKEKYGLERETRRANLLPKFSVQLKQPSRISLTTDHWGVEIRNIGAQTTETRIELDSRIMISGILDFPNIWERSDQYAFDIVFGPGSPPKLRYTLAITFRDSEGAKGKQEFAIYPSGSSIKITPQ